MALAYNAGVGLMDMEMVQYHPTTLAGSGVLLSEAARGRGRLPARQGRATASWRSTRPT